ncbi:glycosyltransferase family 4 protein [Tardiphaga sp. P9-11]|uniref:glycosyltransferase family 4 protein n=1 Tax=Tardiphaga sp. P9-11 TaxID=2024614 RepID=UPI0011F0F1DA|nr:glycosyltransferase family 4 protein [Tardiphaga sp. P9-11]KAA0073023.1 glycosyltransferase [Tardiphaga sp. P9-11]
MKVIVLNNMAPFTWGGAEELAHHLVKKLRAIGVDAENLRIPFSWDPAELLIEQILMCQSFRIADTDRVISLKFPAYYAQHDNKVFWLLHQYRQAYDLWDAGQANIPNTPRGEEIRRLIHEADNQVFRTAKHIYTNSMTTAERLKRYNGFNSDVLMPPLNDPEIFTGGTDDGYLLAPGRINATKRQFMLIDAMQHLPLSARLVIAGPPDGPSDAEDLRRRVEEAGLEDRVTLDLRFLSREELADYVNKARAIAYLPFDEDSVGYVTMEAFQAGKPVLTTTDSGGLLQIVRDRETGAVVAPNSEALAEGMTRFLSSSNQAAALGQAGHRLWLSLGIDWSSTLTKLLA